MHSATSSSTPDDMHDGCRASRGSTRRPRRDGSMGGSGNAWMGPTHRPEAHLVPWLAPAPGCSRPAGDGTDCSIRETCPGPRRSSLLRTADAGPANESPSAPSTSWPRHLRPLGGKRTTTSLPRVERVARSAIRGLAADPPHEARGASRTPTQTAPRPAARNCKANRSHGHQKTPPPSPRRHPIRTEYSKPSASGSVTEWNPFLPLCT